MSKQQISGLNRFSLASRTRAKSCTTCREKKRKCTREYPSCASCSSLGLHCSYQSNGDKSPHTLNQREQAQILIDISSCSNSRTDQGYLSIPARDLSNSRPSASPQSETTIQNNRSQSSQYQPSQRYSLTSVSQGSFLSDSTGSSNVVSGTSAPLTSSDGKANKRAAEDQNMTNADLEQIRHSQTSSTNGSKRRLVSTKERGEFLIREKPSSSYLSELAARASKLKSDTPLNQETGLLSHSDSILRACWPAQMQKNDHESAGINPSLRSGPLFTNMFNPLLCNSGTSLESDMESLYSYVPSKKISDVLFDRYWISIHPIIPILDSQAIHPQYEFFWNDKSSASLPFYIILFSILYAASVSEYEEINIRNPKIDLLEYVKRMKYYMGAAEIALAMYGFPWKLTVVGLQASVILHSVLRNDCRTDDCGSVGSLVRSAQLLELHRDPLNYHNIEDLNIVQSRRILWWQIFYLDCTTSLSSHLPPIIVEGEYDTMLPSKFTRDHKDEYKLDQAIAYANGRYKWVECSNKILRNAFMLKYPDAQTIRVLVDEINNLSFHCSALIQNVLDPANIAPSQDHFVSFSSSMLSTFPDRCYTLLHLVLGMAHNINDTLGKLKYNPDGGDLYRAPQSSSVSDVEISSLDQMLIAKEIHFLQEFCNYGSMPKNVIFLWDIRKFQPIQALLFLLRSLILQVRKFQDSSFLNQRALWKDEKVSVIANSIETLEYLSENTTTLCKERWKLLKDLKNVTWNHLFSQSLLDVTSHISPASLISDNLFSENSEVTGGDISEIRANEDWKGILLDLTLVEQIINDNIFARQWDPASGHFLT
ncbi:uncharacterized protein PRCAT00003826001 [Priceomyces carsonii]|uniref:uncharacterized protein n=1 Tax=Priceomyces carsonii TaxID=28549 RepID=UPI002ED8606D|nr:unnamed protein product [Priceomyces carsonii]